MAKTTYPITELALFPRYQTRGAYTEATGVLPPQFNAARRPKFWEDPAAKGAKLRNVFYAQVIALTDRGIPAVGDDGKPCFEGMTISKVEAVTVNIPPEGTNIDGAEMPEWPMPLKPLPAGHELTFQSGSVPGGGVVSVRDVIAFATEVEGFTAADRAVLRAIAAELGV